VSRVGWHLDDVPQPYLRLRRVAFALIVVALAGAAACGLLLMYDGMHHRSLVLPLALLGAVVVIGMMAGGVFGWTNTKSPRWREWRKTMPTRTPGWPTGEQH
jgi:hypothetical protein